MEKRDGKAEELVFRSIELENMTEEERQKKMEELKAKRDELLKQIEENPESIKDEEAQKRFMGK